MIRAKGTSEVGRDATDLVFQPVDTDAALPAARIRPRSGSVLFLLDKKPGKRLVGREEKLQVSGIDRSRGRIDL